MISNLDDHRSRRTAREWAECECGSTTFVLCGRPADPVGTEHGALVLRRDGSVMTYVGEPTCMDCRRPWLPERAALR